MSSKSFFENSNDEDQGGKLTRKARESPFLVVGLAGCIAATAYGAYKFRQRGSMSTSVFLMQLRVGAQGAVVGCLTLGLAYTMANEYLLKKKPTEDSIKN